MRTLQFAAGDTLWREGEPAEHALLLESGTVEILGGQPAKQGAIVEFGPGAVVGEMALVDERPQTFTTRARTPGQALLLRREEMTQAFLAEPQKCLPFLHALCERLRRLEPRLPAVIPAGGEAMRESSKRLCLWPLSRHTAQLLPEEGLLITSFPFRLGRAEEANEKGAKSLNDLWLLDQQPFQVSRTHITFDFVDGSRYVVRDRGSHLGTIVNETKIGGKLSFREAELEEGDNVIILGTASSPFKFRATLSN